VALRQVVGVGLYSDTTLQKTSFVCSKKSIDIIDVQGISNFADAGGLNQPKKGCYQQQLK